MEEPKDKQFQQYLLIWFAVLVVLTVLFIAVAGGNEQMASPDSTEPTVSANCLPTNVSDAGETLARISPQIKK